MKVERIAALDALRGIAAALVVAHHVSWAMLNSPRFVGHGYLSVDFFFLLSGFVVARTYEPRLKWSMTFVAYARIRLTRLYPLMALGVIAGFVAYSLIGPFIPDRGTRLVAQLLFVPTLWMAGELFALNSVQWSLLVELAANGLHAAILRYLTTLRLAAVVASLAVGEVLTAHHFGNLQVGWSARSFLVGFVRGGFGFFAGVLCYRLHLLGRLPTLRVPWPIVAVALPVLVVVASHYQLSIRWYVDPLIVIVAMPAVLIMGINTVMTGVAKTVGKIAGEISYPMYAIQAPVLLAVLGVSKRVAVDASPYALCAVAAVAVLIAATALMFIDRRLQSKMNPRSHVYPR